MTRPDDALDGSPEVAGRVADGFERVRDAFADTLLDTAGGAAVCLVLDGETVVDLWGGRADGGGGPDRWSAGPLPEPPPGDPERPWRRDTRAVAFSVTKGLLTLSVLHAAAAGALELDRPVAQVWPEFAAAGKDRVTVRQLLAHRAGLPVLDVVLSREQLLAWTPVVDALAAAPPLWEPGSAWSYHALTFGWLAGEVLRRATGLLPGEHLAETFSRPLGLDVAIGVPASEQGDLATVVATPPPTAGQLASLDAAGRAADQLVRRALTMEGSLPFPGVDARHCWNDPDVLAAQIPGANGVGSAADVAAGYAAAVGTSRQPGLIPRAELVRAVRPLSRGRPWGGDPSDPGSTRGTGFQVPEPGGWFLSPDSFGHTGAGGQFAGGDLRHRAGFAYLTNRMGGPDDDRAALLLTAAHACLG